MNLCDKCLQKVGLFPKYHQMIKSVKWCDNCNKPRESLDTMSVVKQLLVTREDR